MKLYKVPYDQIQIGDEVISDITNAKGRIVEKYSVMEYECLDIKWYEEPARYSIRSIHDWCAHVTYVGNPMTTCQGVKDAAKAAAGSVAYYKDMMQKATNPHEKS